MRVTSLCRALLALDIAYCAAALVVPGLPGWKMFESVEHATYTLRAADGRDVDAYAWVPRSARDLEEADLLRVARWLCAEHRELTPLRLDTERLHRTIDDPDCLDHAAP